VPVVILHKLCGEEILDLLAGREGWAKGIHTATIVNGR
jgi:hypothetical protein